MRFVQAFAPRAQELDFHKTRGDSEGPEQTEQSQPRIGWAGEARVRPPDSVAAFFFRLLVEQEWLASFLEFGQVGSPCLFDRVERPA